MQRAKITSAGQLSLPAEVRRRWEVSAVMIEDRGDHLVIRPATNDPIAAFRGLIEGCPMSSDEMAAEAREEEARIEAARG